MQYHRGGVGHLATWQCNKTLLVDKHTVLTDEPASPVAEPGPDDDSKSKDEDNAESDVDEDEDKAESDVDEDREDSDVDEDDIVMADLRGLNDTGIVDVAGFAAL
jgi:hypothetical protein